MSYTICSRFKGEHIVYAGYTICTLREHIVYGAFCGSTMHKHSFAQTLKIQNAVVTLNLRSRSFTGPEDGAQKRLILQFIRRVTMIMRRH